MTNNEGVTFTLKNGSSKLYPQGEPLQFGNAPRGVIFDSFNQWNQYINGRYYEKWINVYHQDQHENWRKQVFDSSGNHLKTINYTYRKL